MKYEKPLVVVLGSALAAIQANQLPKQQSSADSQSHPSAAAYEADE